jgi:hypothetical protein
MVPQGVNGRREQQQAAEAYVVRMTPACGIGDELDAAYRANYRRYAASIIGSVVTPQAQAATLKLVPRSADA